MSNVVTFPIWLLVTNEGEGHDMDLYKTKKQAEAGVMEKLTGSFPETSYPDLPVKYDTLDINEFLCVNSLKFDWSLMEIFNFSE